MEQDIIAVVGAGSGGLAILQLLADIPGIQIKWVYDSNQNAPGLLYAKKKGYPISTDTQFADLVKDDSINLVFEITGQQGVFDLLSAMLPKKTTLIGAHGTKIIHK